MIILLCPQSGNTMQEIHRGWGVRGARYKQAIGNRDYGELERKPTLQRVTATQTFSCSQSAAIQEFQISSVLSSTFSRETKDKEFYMNFS